MEGADWNIGPCDLTAFVEEKSDLSNKKMLYQHGPVPLLNSHFLKSSYKKNGNEDQVTMFIPAIKPATNASGVNYTHNTRRKSLLNCQTTGRTVYMLLKRS